LLWAFLCLVVVILVGLHYVTRDTFIRGPVLHRLLGPNYERNLEIGRIQIGVFPPEIQAFNIQLVDTRPGPGEPSIVAELGQMTFEFRPLPWNTLFIDRVEVRGLEMHMIRDRRGTVNLLRALYDMQEGRIPPPIQYETLAGQPTSDRTVLLDRWSAGNWHLSFIDHYQRDTPFQADLDIAEARLLRGDPDTPLDLMNGLPLGMEAYLQYPPTPDSGETVVRPLHMDLTLTNPLFPRKLGLRLKGEAKETLKELGEEESIGENLFRRDEPVPAWTQSIRKAAPVTGISGTFAKGRFPSTEVSNISFFLRDPATEQTWLELSDGRYDFRTSHMGGNLRLQGTLAQLSRDLPSVVPDEWVTTDSLTRTLRSLARDPATSSTWVRLETGWKYVPEKSSRPWVGRRDRVASFSFASHPGRLSLQASLDLRGIRCGDVEEGTRFSDPCFNGLVRSHLDLAWPALDLTVRQADWEVFLQRSPAPAAESSASPLPSGQPGGAARQGLLLCRGAIEGQPVVLSLPKAIARLEQGVFREYFERTGTTSLPSTPRPHDIYDRALSAFRRASNAALALFGPMNRPPIAVRFEGPPILLADVPWVASWPDGTVTPEGLVSWLATVELFPEPGVNARLRAQGEVSGLRKDSGTPAMDLETHAEVSLTEKDLQIDRVALNVIRPPGNIYEFEIRNSQIELETGEGEWHFESRNLDRGILDACLNYGGPRFRRWSLSHRNLLELLDYAHADAASSASMNFHVDAFVAEHTLVNSRLLLNGLSLEQFRSGHGRARHYDLAIENLLEIDRGEGQIDLRGFSARLSEAGAGSPRVTLQLTQEDPPAAFRADRVPELAHLISTVIEESLAQLDNPSSTTLARLPDTLDRLDRIRGAFLNRSDIELEIAWTGLYWNRIQGVLDQFGLPFLQGAANLRGTFRLLSLKGEEEGGESAGPNRIAEWSATTDFQDLKMESGGETFAGSIAARGTVTPEELRLEAFQGKLANSDLRMQGTFNLVNGQASLKAGIANLGPIGLRALENMRGNRLAEMLRLEHELPTSLLILAAGGKAPRFSLRWQAELDRWGQSLRLHLEKIARDLGPTSGFFGNTVVRTEQDLDFQDSKEITLRRYTGTLSEEAEATTSLLQIELVEPLRLVRPTPGTPWRDARSGTTAMVSFEMTSHLGPVGRRARTIIDKVLDRGIAGGSLTARLQSPLLSPDEPEVVATFQGFAQEVRPEQLDSRFDFVFNGRLRASPRHLSVSDLEVALAPGQEESGVLHGEAVRDFDSGNYSFAIRGEGLQPSLLEWLAGPWRILLSSTGTEADLDAYGASRDRGRYTDRITTVTAQNAALSRRGLEGPGAPAVPLHPPVRLIFSRSTTADTVTSFVLIRALRLEALQQDNPTSRPLLAAELTYPAEFNPSELTLLRPPGQPSPPSLQFHVGPLPLEAFARALARWTGVATAQGTLTFDAVLSPLEGQPAGPETLLQGALRAEGMRLGGLTAAEISGEASRDLKRDTPTSEAVSESTAIWPLDQPYEASVEFTLRSRAGVVSVDKLNLSSANGPGIPPDDLGMQGVVYSRKRGLSPDLRVRSGFLYLAKYWALVRQALRDDERRRANSSGGNSSSNEDAADCKVKFPPSRFRLDLETLQFRQARVHNLEALVRLNGSQCEVPIFMGEIGDGQLNASGTLDWSADPGLTYSSQWEIENVQLQDLLELLAPSFAKSGGAVVTGTTEIRGQGVTEPNLRRYLAGSSSLTLSEGRVDGLPGRWLLGNIGKLEARVEARVTGGNLDFDVAPDGSDARKTLWLRGYVKDIFGVRQVLALGRLELRTIVGPTPPRESGRFQPVPQNLAGVICRISGSLDSTEALDIQVESYEY